MNEATGHRELLELLTKQGNGLVTDGELSHLRRMLRESAASRQAYAQYMVLVAGLHWEFADRGTESLPAQPAVAPPPRSPVLGFLGGVWGWVQSSPRTLVMILSGALAAYFITLFALIPLARLAKSMRVAENPPATGTREQPAPVGTLAAGAKARWSDDLPEPRGAAVRAGEQYKLARGRVELALVGGTQVVIDGPAAWKLESDQRLVFSVGKLTAYVPQAAIGFVVATPWAEVIDLGTEFGVEVDASGQADVHVLQGKVAVKPKSDADVPVPSVSLTAGNAVRVRAGQTDALPIPFEGPRFEVIKLSEARALATKPRLHIKRPSGDEIWLGNLFDDPAGTPLAQAVETDTYAATPEVGDLGVEGVIHGGDRPKADGDWVAGLYFADGLIQIAPHVSFDFSNLGWRGKLHGSIANDAYGKFDVFATGGLSTNGAARQIPDHKLEEGIGMHADSLLTFNIDKIRAAGRLKGRLEFICDRIGMSDDEVASRSLASFHMVVLVSDASGVRTAIVDGYDTNLIQRAGVWSVKSPPSEPLRADGRFFQLRVPLPPEAMYLTLVVTSFDYDNRMDHGVWSGARLEVAKSSAP